MKNKIKEALKNGAMYDFIKTEGHILTKDELIEIIANYDYTIYQTINELNRSGALNQYVLDKPLDLISFGESVIDNLNDYDFFKEDEEIPQF